LVRPQSVPARASVGDLGLCRAQGLVVVPRPKDRQRLGEVVREEPAKLRVVERIEDRFGRAVQGALEISLVKRPLLLGPGGRILGFVG
jgi:hypothetical protein